MTQAPPPPAVAGFCGRCGAPFTGAAGGFCGRCGNPIVAAAPAASGYSYPVAPPSAVPGMRRRLSPTRLWVVGAGAVAALVVVVTVIAVVVRPVGTTCHFSCTRQQGPPLIGNTTYKNAKYGYSVEYLTSEVSATNDPNGVTFTTQAGSQISFIGSSGGDVDGAIQTAFNGLNTNTYQDLKPVGSVRGAEIGLVLAHGTAYTGNYVPPGGGASGPIALIVMAASSNNVTVTTVMFSTYSTDVGNQPYGLTEGQTFDYPITLTHFPGSG